MSIKYVMEPVEIMGLKNLKGGVSQESTWFLGGLFKSPRWSTREEGGQKYPKIGPHGLRMTLNFFPTYNLNSSSNGSITRFFCCFDFSFS